MPKSPKANAPLGGAHVDLAGGLNSTKIFEHSKSSIKVQILDSKSTATSVQLEKILVLLRQGPKTTMELRSHGIMMPASRVFQLKHHYAFKIRTELLPLYDSEGIKHDKCARYHLVECDDREVPQ